jgi:hypothetical protein
VIAHGGGVDELAIFFFPVAFGVGFWLLTRKKPVEAPAASAPAAASSTPRAISDVRRGETAQVGAAVHREASPEVPTPIPGDRKDGATRLRQAMRQASTHEDVNPAKPKVRKRRLDGAARLQLMMNDEASGTDTVAAED